MVQQLRFAFTSAAVLLFLSAGLVHAQSGKNCSYLVLNRTYANVFSGFLNVGAYFGAAPPGVGIVPNGGGGSITFLPNGTFTNKETLAIGSIGLQRDLAISGTYSLFRDTSKSPVLCTGTMSGTGMVNGSPAQFNFQLVVSQDGNRVDAVHTDTGLIVGFASYPMPTWGCRNATVGGKYSVNAQGWNLAMPSVPVEQTLAGYTPFVFSGGMVFLPGTAVSKADFPDSPAGSAAVEAWDTLSINGQIIPRASTGWYKVNRDCTGTVVLRDNLGNPDFHLEMFVGQGARSIDLVNVDTVPGTSTPAFILGTTVHRVGDLESDQ